jgi:hypothetical protein
MQSNPWTISLRGPVPEVELLRAIIAHCKSLIERKKRSDKKGS